MGKGYHDNPKPSGYAIYRAWFDAEEHGIKTDPLTDFLAVREDQLHAWIGTSPTIFYPPLTSRRQRRTFHSMQQPAR
jgi:hypothetical protein